MKRPGFKRHDCHVAAQANRIRRLCDLPILDVRKVLRSAINSGRLKSEQMRDIDAARYDELVNTGTIKP